MKRRFLDLLGATALCITSMGFVLALHAAEPVKPDAKGKGDAVQTEAALKQDQIKRQFEDFKRSLLEVQKRLENGTAADKEKAKVLDKALKAASEKGVDIKFLAIIDALKKDETFKAVDNLDSISGKTDELRRDIKELIKILERDDRDRELADQRAEAEKILARIRELIDQQTRVQTKMELNREKNEKIQKDQKDVREKTEKVLTKGEAKDDKGAKKDTPKGEGKTPGKENKENGKAEAKEDTKENKGDNKTENGVGKEGKEGKDPKAAEGKEGKGPEGKDPKAGDGKENKGNEGKEGKPGENKEGKPGDGKENKGGQGKEGKDPKGAEGKEGNKAEQNGPKGAEGKEGKGGEAKDSKSGEGKGGEGKEGKPGENKEGKPGDGKGGEGKDGSKGDPKGGQGKEGNKGGEGKEGKPGDGKDGKGGDSKEGKPGENKNGKPGDGKGGEGKDANGKGGDPKNGKPSEGKGGDPKNGKPGDPKGGKPGTGDPKGGKPNAEGKGGDPKEGKPGDGKPGDPKEGKPGDSKGGKPSEGKPGDSKGKSEGKGDSKGGESKGGDPKGGKPSEGKPSQGQPSQGQPSQGKGDPSQSPPSSPPPSGDQSNPDAAQIKKQIEDAAKYQKKAEDNIVDPNKKNEAIDNAEDAKKELEKAAKKLEDLLAQLREEELERLLGKLEGRCRLMLDMQIEVRDETKRLNDAFGSKKLDSIQKKALGQGASIQGDKEDEIVKEAEKALDLIRAEGSAVAFAKALDEVRLDMITVSKNLKGADVGDNTQAVEEDIIAALREMLEALKEARKDPMKNKPKPQKPMQSQPQKPQDKKLISDLAELKMIRSMQQRINTRTELYGKQIPKDKEAVPAIEGAATTDEQKKIKNLVEQLKELGSRQGELSKVADDIAKGKNEKR